MLILSLFEKVPSLPASDGSNLGRVNFLLLGSGRDSCLWYGVGKFTLKMSNFSIFSFRVKKITSIWVKKYPGQSRVGFLLTAGQK